MSSVRARKRSRRRRRRRSTPSRRRRAGCSSSWKTSSRSPNGAGDREAEDVAPDRRPQQDRHRERRRRRGSGSACRGPSRPSTSAPWPAVAHHVVRASASPRHRAPACSAGRSPFDGKLLHRVADVVRNRPPGAMQAAVPDPALEIGDRGRLRVERDGRPSARPGSRRPRAHLACRAKNLFDDVLLRRPVEAAGVQRRQWQSALMDVRDPRLAARRSRAEPRLRARGRDVGCSSRTRSRSWYSTASISPLANRSASTSFAVARSSSPHLRRA